MSEVSKKLTEIYEEMLRAYQEEDRALGAQKALDVYHEHLVGNGELRNFHLIITSRKLSTICVRMEGVHILIELIMIWKANCRMMVSMVMYNWKVKFCWLEILRKIKDDGKTYVIVPTPLPPRVTDIDTALQWVYSHIDYKLDMEAWREEYWQDSIQTLKLATGDCEDKAILLTAILRSLGVLENNVRVVVGMVSRGLPTHVSKHAWTECWDETTREWLVLDPTINVKTSWSRYSINYGAKWFFAFNDLYGVGKRENWPDHWKTL